MDAVIGPATETIRSRPRNPGRARLAKPPAFGQLAALRRLVFYLGLMTLVLGWQHAMSAPDGHHNPG